MRLASIAIALLVSGCAVDPEKPVYTTRDCVITTGKQIAPRSFTANLFCESEKKVDG